MGKRRKLNEELTESLRVLPKRSHICPVCSSSIPTPELQSHYLHERNLLSCPPTSSKRPAAVVALAKIVERPRAAKRTEVSSLLHRVRTNRETRRSNCVPDVDSEAEECPVCGLRLAGIGVDGNEHVSSCLDSRVQEERREQGDGWEVYEIGGQRRVRAIGLLEGGVQSLPDAVVNSEDDGVDVFVDVEGDAEAVYGRTQYTEADIINPNSLSPSKPSGTHLNIDV